MLSIEELSELEDDILAQLPDRITEILSRTNRNNELDELLRLLGMKDLLEADNHFETYREGKIVVVGASEVKESEMLAIGKSLGIDKQRFEFCLDYKAIQKYNFKKMMYEPKYRVILFGAVPHSGQGKEKHSSIITELESSDAYPRVERLMSGNTLKITKTSFREKLQQLVDEEYI